MSILKILGFTFIVCLVAACSPTASPTATAAPTVEPTRPSFTNQLVPTTNPDATPEPGEVIEETVRSFFTALFQGEDVTPYICQDVGEKSKLIEAYGPRTEAEHAETVNADQVKIGMSIDPEGVYQVNARGPFTLTVNGAETEINVDMFNTPMVFEDDTWKICG